jgi:D-glycero-D-manno-heptose 1,7-bisphosphate phosphatase
MPIKTIFLDRDGVINIEKNYLYRKDDFEFIDGVFDACRYLSKIGYKLVIVTNQSGISRGYYKISDFLKLNEWMIEQFKLNNINILDTFFCPHSPDSNCNCRKPKPGMLLDAKKKYNINMKKSWMIGDSERDIKAANLAGIENTIMVRSGHKINENNSNAKFFLDSISQINQVTTK